MDNPYEVRLAERVENSSAFASSSGIAIVFAIIGTTISCLIFVGLAYTLQGLYQTFEAIQLYGTGDPKLMAGGISQALVPTVIYGAFGFLGLFTSFITLLISKYRARWFFWVSILLSVVYLIWVPLGTVLGLVFIGFLIAKRKEFNSANYK